MLKTNEIHSVEQLEKEGMAVRTFLTIKLLNNGALQIEGPLADQKLCLDLLGCAKEAIRDQFKQRDQLIIPPGATDFKDVRN